MMKIKYHPMPRTRSKKKKSKQKSKKMKNLKMIQALEQQKKKKEMIIGRKMKRIWKFKMKPIQRYITKMETW